MKVNNKVSNTHYLNLCISVYCLMISSLFGACGSEGTRDDDARSVQQSQPQVTRIQAEFRCDGTKYDIGTSPDTKSPEFAACFLNASAHWTINETGVRVISDFSGTLERTIGDPPPKYLHQNATPGNIDATAPSRPNLVGNVNPGEYETHVYTLQVDLLDSVALNWESLDLHMRADRTVGSETETSYVYLQFNNVVLDNLAATSPSDIPLTTGTFSSFELRPFIKPSSGTYVQRESLGRPNREYPSELRLDSNLLTLAEAAENGDPNTIDRVCGTKRYAGPAGNLSIENLRTNWKETTAETTDIDGCVDFSMDTRNPNANGKIVLYNSTSNKPTLDLNNGGPIDYTSTSEAVCDSSSGNSTTFTLIPQFGSNTSAKTQIDNQLVLGSKIDFHVMDSNGMQTGIPFAKAQISRKSGASISSEQYRKQNVIEYNIQCELQSDACNQKYCGHDYPGCFFISGEIAVDQETPEWVAHSADFHTGIPCQD